MNSITLKLQRTRKFSLIFALLFSLFSCMKISAFDHLAEWQAIKAIYDEKKTTYSSKPYNIANKQELLEVVILMREHYDLDFQKGLLAFYLSSNIRSMAIINGYSRDNVSPLEVLELRLKAELSNKHYDKEKAIYNIKQEIIDHINKNCEDQSEEIIANSKFLKASEIINTDLSTSCPCSGLVTVEDVTHEESAMQEESQAVRVTQVELPPVLTVTKVTVSTAADRSQGNKVGFDFAPRSLDTQRFAPANINELYNSDSKFSSCVSSEVDAQKESKEMLCLLAKFNNKPKPASSFGKYAKSAVALLAAGGLYGASLTEVAKHNPKIEYTAKAFSALSTLYSLYNALRK